MVNSFLIADYLLSKSPEEIKSEFEEVYSQISAKDKRSLRTYNPTRNKYTKALQETNLSEEEILIFQQKLLIFKILFLQKEYEKLNKEESKS